ncbi:MAG: hypothetical protein U9Q66_04120 [Patescibacteria group bacterium]|nr:hypothetical protein [Patescibacteria group bacterium]
MNAIYLPFNSGFKFIASIAHLISNHSQIHTHKPVNQIAHHAAIAAIPVNSAAPNIWKATIKPYIAADSTNATHNIETVMK